MPIQIKHHFLIVKMPSVHIKGRLKTISSRRKMRYDAALITVIFQTALFYALLFSRAIIYLHSKDCPDPALL